MIDLIKQKQNKYENCNFKIYAIWSKYKPLEEKNIKFVTFLDNQKNKLICLNLAKLKKDDLYYVLSLKTPKYSDYNRKEILNCIQVINSEQIQNMIQIDDQEKQNLLTFYKKD